MAAQQPLYRGATVLFTTTFFDVAGEVIQPDGAAVNITYGEGSELVSVLIEMVGPVGESVSWTAEWDTRGIASGAVSWSIHSESAGIPYAVQDGNFILSANNANLVNF